MRLSNLLVINSGAIERVSLEFDPTPEGVERPIILVGPNGSGKTAVLSMVVDALYEFAAAHFIDVAPPRPGGGHGYFRVLGGRTVRTDKPFELVALKFVQEGKSVVYRTKVGTLDPAQVRDDLESFPGAGAFPEGSNVKQTFHNDDWVADEFSDNSYAFFPTGRSEKPYWINDEVVANDPNISFAIRYKEKLSKPIVVNTSIQALKPWIANLMMDISIDAVQITSVSDILSIITLAARQLKLFPIIQDLNAIIKIILDGEDYRFARTNRSHGDGRICIAKGQDRFLPSLDGLSAGQSALLSIFGSVLMYADRKIGRRASDIQGIVVVDEIDQHLHVSLQTDALPRLIKMFPKVQFIFTSHSPLFPLGMRREFGNDGYYLIEMPSGTRIDAERYNEFMAAFERLKETRAFEEAISHRVDERPRVFCEGQTDPEYLRTAAELLKFERLCDGVVFDWIGELGPGGARGGGKDGLEAGVRTFRYNPELLRSKTVFLFDLDAKRTTESVGRLLIRSIIKNEGNKRRTGGIENLLSEIALDDRFFSEQPIKSGDDAGTISKLDKVALCQHLCRAERDPATFEAFRPTLEMLDQTLFGSDTA